MHHETHSLLASFTAGPFDASTESLLARTPLLPGAYVQDATHGTKDESSSNTSSAMTIRATPKEVSVENLISPPGVTSSPHPRANHQREPNMQALPSMKIDTAVGIRGAESGMSLNDGKESYFTANTPSTFPSSDNSNFVSSATQTHPHANNAGTTIQIPPLAPDSNLTASPIIPSLPNTKNIRPQTPPPRAAAVTSTSFELQPRVHRFSLVKSGGGWSPFDMIFGSALGTGSKCDLCAKRLGWKPCLECDDCLLT